MEKELKAILQEKGKTILSDPDNLMLLLNQQGCDVTKVMTLGLVLKSCPPAVFMLQQPQITEAESNVLVSAVVSQTGLSVTAVRRILHTVMSAAEIKSTWTPKLLAFERRPMKELTTLAPGEEEMLAELERALRLPNVSSETLHDLDELSKKGSIRASYLLGEYYKKIDDEEGTITGRQYFLRAARLGYGPANGALADYMVRSNRKNMAAAAACFEDPTSITGHHGRRWKTLAESLLSYREDNKKRTGGMLLLQIFFLALTVAILAFGLLNVGLFGILALVAQVLSLLYLLYASVFGPYFSCKVPGYAMLISWLALVLALL